MFITCAPLLVVGLCLAGMSTHFGNDGLIGAAAVCVLVPVCIFSTELARRTFDRAERKP